MEGQGWSGCHEVNEGAMRRKEARRELSRRHFVRTAASVGTALLAGAGAKDAEAARPVEGSPVPRHWDKVADVVVVGAGATGLPAAIEAAENGASVIVVEQNYDIGGHAIESGANIALGGG